MGRAAAWFGVLLLLSTGAARAQEAASDEAWPDVELVCSPAAKIALVRFRIDDASEHGGFVRLPVAVDGGLSARPATRSADCALAKGRPVRIRAGESQAFAYGEGGAAPPAFFSLWVDRRRLLSRYVWKPGYTDAARDKPRLVGLVIRPGSLTYCTVTEAAPAPSCRRRAVAMTAMPIDRVEYGSAQTMPVGTVIVAAGSTEPALCRRYLRAVGTWFDNPDADGAPLRLPRCPSPIPPPVTGCGRRCGR